MYKNKESHAIVNIAHHFLQIDITDKGFFLMPVRNALKIWRVVVLELDTRALFWQVPPRVPALVTYDSDLSLEFQHWFVYERYHSLDLTKVCLWLWPQHIASALVYQWPWPLFRSLAQVCQWPWPQHNCGRSPCWRVRASIGWFYNRNTPQSPGLMIHHPLPPRTENRH